MTHFDSTSLRGCCLLVSLLVFSQAVESQTLVTRRPTGNNVPCLFNDNLFAGVEFVTFPGSPCNWTLRCDNRGWLLYEAGCPSVSGCHPAGSTYTENCITYTCTASTGYDIITYLPVVISRRCVRGRVCHPLGSTFQELCTTYTCTESTQEGYITAGAVEISRRCQDYLGVCHDSGSLVSRLFPDDVVRHNCNCTVTTSGAHYKCPPLPEPSVL